MTLYRLRRIEEVLSETLLIDGKPYCIHGDVSYSLRPWLQVGYPNLSATDKERLYNAYMSAVREAAEWNFKEIKIFFTSQDMKWKLKCREAPIALMYKSAVLLVV